MNMAAGRRAAIDPKRSFTRVPKDALDHRVERKSSNIPRLTSRQGWRNCGSSRLWDWWCTAGVIYAPVPRHRTTDAVHSG